MQNGRMGLRESRGGGTLSNMQFRNNRSQFQDTTTVFPTLEGTLKRSLDPSISKCERITLGRTISAETSSFGTILLALGGEQIQST